VELTMKEQFAKAPPVTEVAAVVAFARQFRGPDAVDVRREAEDQAIALLDLFAGLMTHDQALQLGRLFKQPINARV